MSLPLPAAVPVRESVLVVDPTDVGGRLLRSLLKSDGRQVHHCATAREALALVEEVRPDVILAALDTADLPGLPLVEVLRERAPGASVLVIAPEATVDGAVLALRAGAVDYVGRPLAAGAVAEKVRRALQGARTARRLAEAQDHARERYGFTQLLSESPRMIRVFDSIRSVAQTDAIVLIRGETGTGKELVARAIHDRSRRRDRPLIGVNCGAFTETLLESELFGHEKGSFTGAIGRRQGVFEMANGGTLFLDELGETSLSVQVNLLRVLEEMTFRRVGGTDSVKVDVRIVAATNVDLEEAVAKGRFRQDLFYRLNVYPIFLPPLRERPEDVPLLLRHFLHDAARDYELPVPAVSPEAEECIARYGWPGNVRQLRAFCERWVIQCAGADLRVDALPPEIARRTVPTEPTGAFRVDENVPLDQLLSRASAQIQREYLHKLLTRHRGHMERTATSAGLTRRTLYTRMRELGLDSKNYK